MPIKVDTKSVVKVQMLRNDWSLDLERTLYLSSQSPSKSSFPIMVWWRAVKTGYMSWTTMGQYQYQVPCWTSWTTFTSSVTVDTPMPLRTGSSWRNSQVLHVSWDAHNELPCGGWGRKPFQVCLKFWKLNDVGFTIPHLQCLKSRWGSCFYVYPIQPPQKRKRKDLIWSWTYC